MACGRTVVATRIGGPPEFVPPEAGVLVDPLDGGELARALELAAALPVTERGGARRRRGARRQASGGAGGGDPRSEPFEIGQPDLDERADRVLETVLAGDRERLLVALPDLLGETPCFRRLSPVSSRSWISRAGCPSRPRA